MPKGKGYKMKGYSNGKGVMGHEKSPSGINAFAAEKKDLGRLQLIPMDYRGTPDQAFGYKY